MKRINNILICGLGGVGSIYAKSFIDLADINLKVLVNYERLEEYKKNPRIINGIEYNFNYITPDYDNYKADLIIIACKSNGLNDVLKSIKNFIHSETIIMSLINGITSENKIAEIYGINHVIHSYIICHTIFRNNNIITHDGVTKIVFNSINNNNEQLLLLKNLFNKAHIDYETPDNILKSMWIKYCLNCCANQISGLTEKTFGEMLNDKEIVKLMEQMTIEISEIAKLEGIKDTFDFWELTFNHLKSMIPNGKTSLLQDIENNRTPEIDLFGETLLSLANKHSINIPFNKQIYLKLCKKLLNQTK